MQGNILNSMLAHFALEVVNGRHTAYNTVSCSLCFTTLLDSVSKKPVGKSRSLFFAVFCISNQSVSTYVGGILS